MQKVIINNDPKVLRKYDCLRENIIKFAGEFDEDGDHLIVLKDSEGDIDLTASENDIAMFRLDPLIVLNPFQVWLDDMRVLVNAFSMSTIIKRIKDAGCDYLLEGVEE